MPHEINQMAYVGKEPWHGLGTPLPTNADYDSIVQAADFYTAVERDVFAPPMECPIPDKKALFREDTGDYLSTVNRGYEVIQFEEVARTLVEAAGGVRCIFQRGHLPCHRTGRLWRIRKDQLLSFLERGPSPADAAVSLEERATRLLARRAR